MRFYKSIFFSSRLYIVLFSVSALFVFGYFIPLIFLVAKVALLLASGLIITDFILIYAGGAQIDCNRILPNRMSMGDSNKITLILTNRYFFSVSVEIVDEIPVQFQIRNFKITRTPLMNETMILSYDLTPKERGDFEFGVTNIFAATLFGLILRRYIRNEKVVVPVYPSFIQMRKYELLALTNRISDTGVKKVRMPGKHTEFDQVRDYITGDDYRLMNWKATAKKAHLMINQYQEERSKDIYNIIDMGRVMKMPFEEMTLLDYSINASLAISNIAILKHDKAGLVTFSTQIDSFVIAEKRNNQMATILQTLYNQKTDFYESNYELLYMTIKKRLRQRSLIILYTNFESLTSLNRHMAALHNLALNHLILAVVFKNTEIEQMTRNPVNSLDDVYTSVIAEKFLYEKKLIVKELNKHGINAILTTPGNLTTGLIDKYLELKAGERI